MIKRLQKFIEEGSVAQHLIALLLLALVVFSAGFGLRDPWPADEPRYALIAKEMVESGRWLFPHVGNVLYPDKPPVFFWSIAIFYALTGSLKFSFLLPSLLASLLTLTLVYDLGRRLWNRRTGFIAAAALLACLQFVLQARTAQIDALVSMWITLGMYGMSRHLLLGPNWKWFAIAGAAMGAGIITKGVGFLPLLALLPWGFMRWRGWELPKFESRWWQWPYVLLGLLAVVLAWGGPMLYSVLTSSDPELMAYRDNILFKQTAERYANSWVHVHPLWYYVVEVIPVFWFPLSVLLPWLIPAWWRELKRRDVKNGFLLGWAVLVLLFFSSTAGKRGVYILPALPILTLAAAPLLQAVIERRGARRMLSGATLLFGALLLSAVAYYTLLSPEKGAALVEKFEVEAPWAFLVSLGLAGVIFALLGRVRYAPLGAAGFLLTFWLLFGWWGNPLLNGVRTPAIVMDETARNIGPDAGLGLIGWKEQHILHADRQVTHFGFRRHDPDNELADGIAWLLNGNKRYLLVDSGYSLRCFEQGGMVDMGYRHRAHWLLAGPEDVAQECREQYRNREPIIAVNSIFKQPYR